MYSLTNTGSALYKQSVLIAQVVADPWYIQPSTCEVTDFQKSTIRIVCVDIGVLIYKVPQVCFFRKKGAVKIMNRKDAVGDLLP